VHISERGLFLNSLKDIFCNLIWIFFFFFLCSVLKEFEQVPSHLTEELHLFSLDDLVKIKRGQLLPLLKDILKTSISHVDGCELCQAKGFICEFCQSADLLFAFQIAKCKRCTACFHKACFKSGGCPKCLRIAARRMLSETPSAVPL
uniref:Rubicon Homology domain-containing protein n=1 Tax=Anas zonorhyncha TaxID=75864 RepID=A0A8B9VJ28_9AVES